MDVSIVMNLLSSFNTGSIGKIFEYTDTNYANIIRCILLQILRFEICVCWLKMVSK
jgi:hypothetical protein